MRRRFLLLGGLLAAGTPSTVRAQDGLTVMAAASLTDAMKELGAAWATKGNPPPRFSFGASSALARQIEQGAPAVIFASADEPWADYLQQRDLLISASRTSLLGNSLVLVAPADTRAGPVTIGKDTDFAALLGPAGRIATGDPAAVPVGKYAEASLRSLGLWDGIAPRIARAENVRAALLLVERGEAPLGIVYATDAAASRGVKVLGTFPSDSHPAITYPFALVKGGDTPAGRGLLQFLTGPEATPVYERLGFTIRR